MPASPAIDRRSSAGFTLVELMLSVTILALLVVMLGSLFGQVSSAWVTGQGDAERRRNSRAMTDFIGNELRSAVVPIEQASTVNKATLQFLINPTTDFVPEKFANADTIFWQAPIATDTSYGDLAEVGYFVAWPDTGRPRPSLRRFFINPSKPSATDESGETTATVPNENFLINRNQRWLSPELIAYVAPATAPGYRGLFAENVVGFWVTPYQPDGTPLLTSGKKTFDSRVGYQFRNARGALEDRFLPAKVRVSLAQLDSQSAGYLDGVASQVRDLVKRSDVTDAASFLEAFRAQAQGSAALTALLKGLRIYSTEVQLENAR